MVISEHFKKHGYVHCFWIFVIMSLMMIGLVVRKPDADLINEFISFSATLASLLLALVAIFYSIVSNQSLASSLAGTADAAFRVTEGASKMDAASDRLAEETRRLSEEVSQVPISIHRISDEIGNRIDAFSDQRSNGATQEGQGATFNRTRVNLGLGLSLYALVQSCHVKKPIDVKAIRATAGGYYGGILFGVLSAAKYFRPYSIEIEAAGSNFMVLSIGTLDEETILSEDYASRPSAIAKAKRAIDNHLGLMTEESDKENGEVDEALDRDAASQPED